jgi:four helix bundle protein
LPKQENADSRRDLAAKYAIARREACESAYWLRLLVEAGFATPGRTRSLEAEASEFVAILTASIRKLRGVHG